MTLMLKPWRLALVVALIAVGGALTAYAQLSSRHFQDEGNWAVEIVTDDLDYPWDLDHADQRLVITEKGGHVVMVEAGGVQRYPLQTEEPLRTEGGAGLLGLALAPDFSESGRAFFYHSYTDGSQPVNRVIEARFDGEAWHETRTLLDGIPGHRLYNGGRIAIGPEGHLYVTTGWTEDWERPQDLGSLAGKVLRMTLQGQVPADNPFDDSYVYSYGHRNPQGLAWSETGELFVAEHGQVALDEINLIRPGANYGWPVVSGDEEHEGMETPFIHSGRDTWAPSGIAFAGDTLLMAALRGQGLYVLDDERREMRQMFTSNERFRQVLPVDEALFIITTNRSPRREGSSDDRLIRLSPAPD